jgi:hypothetical protein
MRLAFLPNLKISVSTRWNFLIRKEENYITTPPPASPAEGG